VGDAACAAEGNVLRRAQTSFIPSTTLRTCLTTSRRDDTYTTGGGGAGDILWLSLACRTDWWRRTTDVTMPALDVFYYLLPVLAVFCGRRARNFCGGRMRHLSPLLPCGPAFWHSANNAGRISADDLHDCVHYLPPPSPPACWNAHLLYSYSDLSITANRQNHTLSAHRAALPCWRAVRRGAVLPVYYLLCRWRHFFLHTTVRCLAPCQASTWLWRPARRVLLNLKRLLVWQHCTGETVLGRRGKLWKEAAVLFLFACCSLAMKICIISLYPLQTISEYTCPGSPQRWADRGALHLSTLKRAWAMLLKNLHAPSRRSFQRRGLCSSAISAASATALTRTLSTALTYASGDSVRFS